MEEKNYSFGKLADESGKKIGSDTVSWEKNKVVKGTVLETSSKADLTGLQLNPMSYLAMPGMTSYGSKTFLYTTQDDCYLLKLNSLTNVNKLMKLMDNDETTKEALIMKVGAKFDKNNNVISIEGIKTASKEDKLLAPWFLKNKALLDGTIGWHAMLQYEEFMFTETSILGRGKKRTY